MEGNEGLRDTATQATEADMTRTIACKLTEDVTLQLLEIIQLAEEVDA